MKTTTKTNRRFVLPREVRLANTLESNCPAVASDHALRMEVAALRRQLQAQERQEIARAHRLARLDEVTVHIRDNTASFRRKFRAVTYRPAPTELFVIAPEK